MCGKRGINFKRIAPDEIKHFYTAILHAYRGENEKAIEELNISYSKREWALSLYIKNNPMIKSLRSEPGYVKIIQQLDWKE